MVIGLGAAVLLSAGYLFNQFNRPTVSPPTQPAPAAQIRPHKPVYMRLGRILEIGEQSLTLETKKLEGQGSERLAVQVPAETSILEIRVPSYINTMLAEKLRQGKSVVERVPVPFSQLYIGQELAVLSSLDMYGESTVTAARLEYKVVVNTEASTP